MIASPKIVIFGLSANPPTGLAGHTGIIQELANTFDEVWVLPVYKHIYSSKSDLADFHHRLNMCKISFIDGLDACSNKVKVLEVEKEIVLAAQVAVGAESGEQPMVRCGSIDVIRHLKAEFPGVSEWHWALGADTYNDLRAGKWKASDEFQKEVRLLVIPRIGDALVDLQGNATKFIVSTLGGVSSSFVRSTTDEFTLADDSILIPSVFSYMKKNRLYGWSRQGIHLPRIWLLALTVASLTVVKAKFFAKK